LAKKWRENKSHQHAFESSTGTAWLPIDHCFDESGTENGSRDSEVKLQHLEKIFDYKKEI
jgi:hypothetical protein